MNFVDFICNMFDGDEVDVILCKCVYCGFCIVICLIY